MYQLRSIFIIGLGFAAALSGQETQTQWMSRTPSVARAGQTITFRTCIRGNNVTRVAIEPRLSGQQAAQNLVNEGSCVWRGQFVAPEVGLDDVFRPEIGFLRVYAGTTLIETLNVFSEVFTDELPLLPVVPLGPGVQRTNYVVNIGEPRVFPANGTVLFQPDLAAATNRFYQYLPDQFDQLNIVFARSYPINRHHSPVRQLVSGIGTPIPILNSDSYGSAARLQGVNVFPLVSAFDGGERTQSHEFGHQWVNYVRSGPLAVGRAHWPISTMANGVMGGDEGAFGCSLTLENGVLVSRVNSGPKVFNPLDLYMMGVIPAEQVPDQYIVTDANAVNRLRNSCIGPALTPNQFEVLRIADVVAQLGPRVPSAAQEKKHYRLATIVVSDALLSQEAMSFYSFFARRAEEKVRVWTKGGFAGSYSNPMWVASGGRLSFDTRIVLEPVAEIAGGGVVNGAFTVAEGLAPGGLASIFGTNLGGANASASSLPLPSSLGTTKVFVNGRQAPLFFSSNGQVNFLVPSDITPSPMGFATVRVQSQAGDSNLAYVPIRPNAPAILTWQERRAIVVDAQNQLITADNPARSGRTLVVYLTGIGQTTPATEAGEAAPTNPLAQCAVRPSVRFGATLMTAEFCGLTPGLTGLAQINFRIPPGLPEGDATMQIVWGNPNVVSNAALIRVAR
ncbi:MAG: hypothetical protein FJW36_08065 [Acidobacteria bacterium]|nr:hypothetical protein [Acidobacteriota bacterium]